MPAEAALGDNVIFSDIIIQGEGKADPGEHQSVDYWMVDIFSRPWAEAPFFVKGAPNAFSEFWMAVFK